MKNKIFYLITSVVLILTSCASNSEQYIEHIEGYWEINSVSKNNTLIKEYNISTTVDFFEVKENLSGFRKKVSPTLNGTYIVTQDQSPFVLKMENDSLNIYYTKNDIIIKETIVRANKEELIISNAEGFTYTYKPYKKIEF